MGASASVVCDTVAFSDSTITDNESIIRRWEGVDDVKFALLKEAYEGVKMESRAVILKKLNEVRVIEYSYAQICDCDAYVAI